MNESRRIYVVEDSPTQALAVKRVLLQIPKVECKLFSDGLEAYRAVLEEAPDIILMDLILPSLHGLAMCRLLKFHSDYQDLQILLFSSITESDIVMQAWAAGANHFLQKPFTPDALRTKVQEVIDELAASKVS
ncbi:response regulator [bacterium]|nr:response regulator [bacterium]